jgi:hypothetical protein
MVPAVEATIAEHVGNATPIEYKATGQTEVAFEYSMATIAVLITSASIMRYHTFS